MTPDEQRAALHVLTCERDISGRPMPHNGLDKNDPACVQRLRHLHAAGLGLAPISVIETDRPRIVCLCGSTRFYDAFQQANYDLTMAGHIVLSVGFYPHSKAVHGHGEGVGHDSAEKVALDELHLRKIDLADEVVVLNVDGYIGESTRREIAYAKSVGKPVRYLAAITAALEGEGDG